MNYLRAGALVGLALASMMVNCGDRDVSRLTGAIGETPEAGEGLLSDRCVPGQTFACMGACGAPGTGYQVCAADGRSYGGCVCPALAGLGPLSATEGNEGGRIVGPLRPQLGGPSVNPSRPSAGEGVVGAACRGAGDCLGGLECFTPGGGALDFSGPAGGYCTSTCANDAACQNVDPGSECVGLAGKNICVRSCASRATPTGVSKCLDRSDVTCVSVAALGSEPPGDGPQRGVCLPSCQSDAQCGPGLFCNLGNGLCSSERRAGAPLGSVCDAAETCASGLCLTLSTRFEGICSAFCRFGGPGCGFDDSSTAPEAGCALAQVPNEGPGDRGFCLELCQVASDCREPGAVCIATTASSGTRACVVPTTPPPVVTSPDAGAPARLPIGAECSNAAECGAGRECLRPDADPFGLGGGLAGGYCSALCTSAACPEAGTVCVGTSQSSQHCVRACSPTPAGSGDCGDRAGLVCIPLGNDPNNGFCLPDCTSGADCGALSCDPGLGLCVDEPAPECAQDEDCLAAQTCVAGSCVAATGACTDDADCASGDCDPESQTCRTPTPGCIEDSDCTAGVCDVQLAQCVPAPGSCTEDADCGALVCDTARGVCVEPPAACTSNAECGDQVCDTVAGQCVPPAPECTLDAECGVQRCDTASGTCVEAACTLDADCRAGVCNRATRVCISAPPISVGGACTRAADCAGGRCLTLDGITGLCSAVCSVGSDLGCEIYGSDAACVPLDPNQPTLNRCLELCNSAADCAQPSYECVPFGGTTLVNNRSGLCLPPQPSPPP